MDGIWFLPPLALLLVWLTLTLLLWGRAFIPLDHPNERSLHSHPTPRIGGVGIMVAVAVCAFWLPPAAPFELVGIALGLAALSFLDDLRGLPVSIRFAGHFLAAGATLYALPDMPFWAAALSVFALAWGANLYNFMDGADGLAGGMALFGFAAYGLAAWLGGAQEFALLAWVIAAAAGGFLLFNFPPARVFMGDAGSIPLGYLAAALGLAGWQAGLWPWVFPLLVFSPFIVDATLTLLRRGVAAEKIWQAHHNHYYQRLVRRGLSHRRLAWAAYGLMLATAVSGLVLVVVPHWQWGLLAVWGVGYTALARAIDQLWQEGSHGS